MHPHKQYTVQQKDFNKDDAWCNFVLQSSGIVTNVQTCAVYYSSKLNCQVSYGNWIEKYRSHVRLKSNTPGACGTKLSC